MGALLWLIPLNIVFLLIVLIMRALRTSPESNAFGTLLFISMLAAGVGAMQDFWLALMYVPMGFQSVIALALLDVVAQLIWMVPFILLYRTKLRTARVEHKRLKLRDKKMAIKSIAILAVGAAVLALPALMFVSIHVSASSFPGQSPGFPMHDDSWGAWGEDEPVPWSTDWCQGPAFVKMSNWGGDYYWRPLIGGYGYKDYYLYCNGSLISEWHIRPYVLQEFAQPDGPNPVFWTVFLAAAAAGIIVAYIGATKLLGTFTRE